jgi:multiple sugar transport system ATP-binding protein
MRGTGRSEREQRVASVAQTLGLEHLLDRRPAALSGGQRQRVAVGRAIVREPAAFLMDEPLSNLDAKLRVGMRTSLQQLHNRLATTTVYVTHDQIEAMTLGQRVAVMRLGKMQQVDAPQRLYEEPVNTFVAAFIGSPSMNLVEARIEGDAVTFGGFRIPLARDRRPNDISDGRVILGIRPEAFEDAEFASRDLPTMEVDVEVIEELGSDSHIFFPVEAEQIVIEDAVTDNAEDDTSILAEDAERTLLIGRVDARTKARSGGKITLAVDPSRLYFFAPESGESLLLNGRAAS